MGGSAADAAADQVLFAGSGRAVAQTPFDRALADAGARHLLAGAHGIVPLSARVRFQPPGRGTPIVAATSFTVPAAR